MTADADSMPEDAAAIGSVSGVVAMSTLAPVESVGVDVLNALDIILMFPVASIAFPDIADSLSANTSSSDASLPAFPADTLNACESPRSLAIDFSDSERTFFNEAVMELMLLAVPLVLILSCSARLFSAIDSLRPSGQPSL